VFAQCGGGQDKAVPENRETKNTKVKKKKKVNPARRIEPSAGTGGDYTSV